MTSVTGTAAVERSDTRTIVGGGVILGLLTAAGVTAFALLSRVLEGTAETIVQSVLIVVGGVVFSYLPAAWVRPRSADAIGWSALLGLLGALAFTVVDTVVLRPAHLYHWSWDAIGGGSGFWYVPVWWMGAAFLAWQGAIIVRVTAGADAPAGILGRSLQSIGIAIVLFVVLTATRAPFHSAIMALAFTVGIVLHAALSAALNRR